MSKVTVVSRPNRITIASKGVQGAVGPEGPEGIQGVQGEKGDTGDVTPEALAARDAAVDAADEAAASADLADQARLLGATIGFATKADMDASLAHPAGTLALVTSDATPANNGTYRKTGASGSGSWVQSADRVSGLEGRVGTVEAKTVDFRIVRTSNNMFNKNTATTGKTFDLVTGNVTNSSPFYISDFIPVEPSRTYYTTATGAKAGQWDASKNYIGQLVAAEGAAATAPSAAFVRISGLTSGINAAAFYGRNYREVYDEYSEGAVLDPTLVAGSISPADTSFVKARVLSRNLYDPSAEVPGYGVISNGSFAKNASSTLSGWIEVTPGQSYVAPIVGGFAYYDADRYFIAYLSNGSVAPAGAKWLRASFLDGWTRSVYAGTTVNAPDAYEERLEIPDLYIPREDNHWAGKNVVWIGTSIPAGGGYPEDVCAEIGANCINIARSSQKARAFMNAGVWYGQSIVERQFTLEKADVSARFGHNIGLEVSPTDYLTVQPGSGFVLTQGHIDNLVRYNYENTLLPVIDDGDLFVIDHGINDRTGQSSFPMMSAAAAGYNRAEFAGAINYIVKKIYDAKKAAGKDFRIAFVTHFSRSAEQANADGIINAQIDIANHWGGELINLADSLGVNDLNIKDLTISGDALHFAPGSTIAKRYVRFIVNKLEAMAP